jgi:hypothetical protein
MITLKWMVSNDGRLSAAWQQALLEEGRATVQPLVRRKAPIGYLEEVNVEAERITHFKEVGKFL